jgi:hypothetical protein
MAITRRNIAKLLGIAAASPAKAAESVAQGFGFPVAGIGASLQQNFNEMPPFPSANEEVEKNVYLSAANYVMAFGMPDFVEADLRGRANDVHHIDYDIAIKRSWSLSVKVATQRERNYKELCERYKKFGTHTHKKNAFKKLTGFYWPW